MAESKMAEFKMAAIIKLIRSEEGRVSEVFFFWKWWEPILAVWVSLRGKTKMAEVAKFKILIECKMAESKMAEFKMAAIIKRLEWVRNGVN